MIKYSSLNFLIIIMLTSLIFTGYAHSQTREKDASNVELIPRIKTEKIIKLSESIIFNYLTNADKNFTKNTFLSAVAVDVSSESEDFFLNYFPTVELNFTIGDEKFEGGLLLVKPVFDLGNHVGFAQGSLFKKDDRATINMGLGYRHLEFDNTLLLGINAFYDHEFPYNHARASLGFEARTTVGEFNANVYKSLSRWQSTKNAIEEKALGGYDIEFGLPVPYLNWSKIYVRKFKWESEISGTKDIGGHDVTLKMTFPFMDGLTMEAGHRDYNSQADDEFITVSYRYSFQRGSKKKKRWVNDSAFKLKTMKSRRFDKVRRENLIFKQKKSLGVLIVGGF